AGVAPPATGVPRSTAPAGGPAHGSRSGCRGGVACPSIVHPVPNIRGLDKASVVRKNKNPPRVRRAGNAELAVLILSRVAAFNQPRAILVFTHQEWQRQDAACQCKKHNINNLNALINTLLILTHDCPLRRC